MISYKNFNYHFADVVGKRKKYDNTIYTLDIETTSYYVLDNKVYPAVLYDNLEQIDKDRCIFGGFMYIWMFSINNVVYYGRTWNELKIFLNRLEMCNRYKKIVFIHNFGFEFQFMQSYFKFENVFARKSRHPLKALLANYNIEIRCSYYLTNCALEKLPELFSLSVKKLVGNLDYNKLRTPETPLTPKELEYCENDCLVVYEYIKRELETYEQINKIPLTSTGHVRLELKEKITNDYSYKYKVRKAINTNPHIYNLLEEAFQGGYTHANCYYADIVLKNVSSYDFTSSYPYVLVTHKFPSTEFKKCNISKVENLSERFAYLIVLKLENIKCRYYNTFISKSRCRSIKNGHYDNGRIISADEIELVVTDIDLKIIMATYNFKKYEFKEIYYSLYNYLPKQFIEFVLEKYVLKTQYKNVPGKELQYAKEKNKYNALYGMSVTNNIRDEVVYDNEAGWNEIELENEEIINRLDKAKKDAFLSFSYGVWVTAHARYNLLTNLIKLDDFVVYSDTDSLKLLEGYDESVIDDYNKNVVKKINNVAKTLEIDVDKFAPKDSKGKSHMLGLFDYEGKYDEFITQGAKKYAIKENNIIKITVAGVPKTGANGLKNLDEFRDNLIFHYKDTNKKSAMYVDNQEPIEITDYLGKKYIINDKTGVCIIPQSYTLSKSNDYVELINNRSSNKAIYKEVGND